WAERPIVNSTEDPSGDRLSSTDLIAQAQSRRQGRFEFAAEQVEAPARALVRSAEGEEALHALELAAELSPGLPLAQFALAAELGRRGEFREALTAGRRGALAVPQHVEARLWWMGSAMVLVALVTITSALSFILAVGFSFFRQSAHDLGDVFSQRMPAFARAALLLACLLGPLSLGEGILGLALGGFAIGAVYGRPSHRTMLVLSAALLMLGLFPLTERAGRALHALDADPVASSALAVVRGRATSAQLDLLEKAAGSGGDVLALRSLAVQAGRKGDTETARALFSELLQRKEGDPMALTVLGNMSFRSGDVEEAIRRYEGARRRETSFELSFNMAQVYAKNFRLEDFHHAMVAAQKLDSERATRLAQLGNPDFVIDPPFPMDSIRGRMLNSADGAPWVRSVVDAVAPGWLGRDVRHMLAGFGFVWLLSLLVRSRYQHAGHCERCGCTICARCDDGMWNSDICDSCHFLFSRPQATDPALRTLRIKALGVREKRAKRLSTFFSLLVPGVAGMLARRPDLAFLSIFYFVGAAVFWIFRQGPVPEPLVVGDAAWVIFGLVSGLLFVSYVFSLIASLAIRRSQ
ncbi:MAG: tetratricopeptide repeat protein, partial [Myxococcota bacterium]